MAQKVNIDGKEYEAESLPEAARVQIANLRATEQELSRQKAAVSMLETARAAYARALKEELNKLNAKQ